MGSEETVCDTPGMAGSASVGFNLDDGDMLVIPDDELHRIYAVLWELSAEPGAVSTAALVNEALRTSEFARSALELSAPQSAVLRQALALLR